MQINSLKNNHILSLILSFSKLYLHLLDYLQLLPFSWNYPFGWCQLLSNKVLGCIRMFWGYFRLFMKTEMMENGEEGGEIGK